MNAKRPYVRTYQRTYVQPIVPFVLGLVTMLVSAKAHGRELRLERELEGHMDVDFAGENHPWVAGLWQRDRAHYWRIASVLMLGVVLAAVLARPPQWPWLLAAAPLVGMTVAFTIMGTWSLARRLRTLRLRPPPSPSWRRAAARGSLAWWVLVGAGGLAVVATFGLR